MITDVRHSQKGNKLILFANQKYRKIKRCLFPAGGVARRCHRAGDIASSRLALRKNPSVLFFSAIYNSVTLL